jgi:hypothetical protein
MADEARSEPARGEGRGFGLAQRRLRVVYGAAVPVAALLTLFHGVQLVGLIQASSAISLIAGLLLGALAADGLSGLIHWACDTWGSETTPWLGSGLIYSFREHHREPRAMLEHDWIEVNGEVAAAAGVGLVVLTLAGFALDLRQYPFAYAFIVSSIGVSALANQLHQWAHMIEPPRLVRILQSTRLILTPSRHEFHHQSPHTTGYCISTGWLNPVLDRADFWRVLERGIETLTGARARGDPRTIR